MADQLKAAAQAIIDDALEGAEDNVHVCDRNNIEAKLATLKPSVKALYDALSAEPAVQNVQAGDEANRIEVLLEVIRCVRGYPDFDEPSWLGEMMDQALAGKTPDSLGAIEALSRGAAPSQPVAGKPSDELTFADLQSMYSGQCQLTDELAAKLEAGSDKVLLARIAELESDLAEMNKRYIANTIAKVTPLVPSDEQIMSLWHSRVSSWRLSYAKHEIASICTFARDLLTTTANAGKVDDTEYGWLVENGRDVPDLRYRTMDNSGITWTNDHNKALRFARRADAEMFAAEDEDAWRIVQHAWDNVAPPVDEPVDRYGRTAAQELQRQIDNKLLRLIQQFFPSLPVAPGYTDWAHWLRFANEAAKIHASQPLAEVKP